MQHPLFSVPFHPEIPYIEVMQYAADGSEDVPGR